MVIEFNCQNAFRLFNFKIHMKIMPYRTIVALLNQRNKDNRKLNGTDIRYIPYLLV